MINMHAFLYQNQLYKIKKGFKKKLHFLRILHSVKTGKKSKKKTNYSRLKKLYFMDFTFPSPVLVTISIA